MEFSLEYPLTDDTSLDHGHLHYKWHIVTPVLASQCYQITKIESHGRILSLYKSKGLGKDPSVDLCAGSK